MNFRRLRPGERYRLWDVLAGYFRPDDQALTIYDPYLYAKRHFKNVRAVLDGVLAMRTNPTPMPVCVETTSPSQDYAVKDQNVFAPRFEEDCKALPIVLDFRIGRRHDRELQIVRADGTVTVVLMGNGLDFLNEHGSPRREIYLAAFETTVGEL
jgi:hypothetical protein